MVAGVVLRTYSSQKYSCRQSAVAAVVVCRSLLADNRHISYMQVTGNP